MDFLTAVMVSCMHCPDLQLYVDDPLTQLSCSKISHRVDTAMCFPSEGFFFGQMTKCDSDARQGCTCKMLTFSKGWFCFKLSPQLELDLHSTALQFKKCVPYLSCFLPCPLRFFFIGEGPYLWSAGFPISSFSLALPLINKALVQITSSWHLYLGGSGQTQMAWTCAGGCLGRKGKYANPALWVWSVCNGCQERCGEIF